MLKKLNEYFNELNKLSENDNNVYSPVSTRSALQLYKELRDSDLFDSILGGINYLKYIDAGNSKYINKIWVNTYYDNSIPAKLQKYAHFIDMTNSEAATKTKNLFVAKETNNFIENTPTILSNLIAFDLMNILYFKDEWKKTGGYKVNNELMPFHNINGSTKEIKNFIADTDTVYENNSCYIVLLKYKNGNDCWLIYPKNDINSVNFDNLECVYNTKATLYIPEFEIENNYKLDKIFEINDDLISIDQVAKIKFDHKGTEAAAVTEVSIRAMSFRPNNPTRITLKFDKPFMYAIKDFYNNDFIFIGKIVKF